MKFDPAILEATAQTPSCPDCGGRHYAVSNRKDESDLKCESVICVDCGFDILEAYRDSRARMS
jgi:hypothetical protein